MVASEFDCSGSIAAQICAVSPAYSIVSIVPVGRVNRRICQPGSLTRSVGRPSGPAESFLGKNQRNRGATVVIFKPWSRGNRVLQSQHEAAYRLDRLILLSSTVRS
jgi:hypothetical protein